MKWFLTVLSALAIVASPAAASANTESEAVSTKPIVIAYIPEHLQRRVPGHQHKHQAEDIFVEPAEDGLGIEYQEWKPTAGLERKRRRKALGLSLGLGIPLVAVGVGMGVAISASSRALYQLAE